MTSTETTWADDRNERARQLAVLIDRVAACRICPTMEGRRRALSIHNGTVDARVLFIAEAPGRLGADRTGIPMTSDQTGRNFSRLLALTDLDRGQIFVTNAVLCNPRNDRGLNRPPSPLEVANCADHLQAQLEVVAAPVIVTLGVTALRALERIAPHGLILRESVGRAVEWSGRILVPLYHPGPQAMMHRDFATQSEDYRALGRLLGEDPSPRA